jgi:hypothetical protein
VKKAKGFCLLEIISTAAGGRSVNNPTCVGAFFGNKAAGKCNSQLFPSRVGIKCALY